jgi:hypothetical protein
MSADPVGNLGLWGSVATFFCRGRVCRLAFCRFYGFFLNAFIGRRIYFGVVEVLKYVGYGRVSWEDLLIVCLVILGVVLFLYGSNYYNAVVGYAGLALIVGGIIAEIVLKVLESVRKRGEIS